MSEVNSSQWKSLLFSVTGRVCLVLFLDVLAFSIVIPVLPNMILHMVGGDVSEAARLQGLAASVDGTLKFFMQPFLGRLSDSIGRKPILIYSLAGSAVSFSLYVISPSVVTLFVSHALHGLSQCTFLICMCAISDFAHDPNDPSALTHSFGLVGVSLGVAFVIGPIVGGIVAQKMDFQAVYALSTLLFIATFWTLFQFLEETLPPSLRRPFSWREAIPLRSAKAIFSKSYGLVILAISYFLCSLTVGVYNLWILFATVKFGWNTLMSGVLLSVNGLVVVIGQGFVLRALVPKYSSESTIALVSYFSHALLFVTVGLASTGNAMFAAILCFGIPSAMGEPAIKSVISHCLPKEEQGSLQGVMGSVYVLAGVISPPLFSALFRYGISESMRNSHPSPCPEGYNPSELKPEDNPCGGYPELPFLVQAVVFIFATLLMSYGFKMVRVESENNNISSQAVEETELVQLKQASEL